MVQLYVKKGLAEGKARAAIGAMAASPEVRVMRARLASSHVTRVRVCAAIVVLSWLCRVAAPVAMAVASGAPPTLAPRRALADR